MICAASITSPFGPLTVWEADGVITRLTWRDEAGGGSPLLTEAIRQLTAYFDHRLTTFDLSFDYGTGLSAQVRRAMAAIPFGETRTYGDIAKAIGAPAQAVGQACGANPIPILIP